MNPPLHLSRLTLKRTAELAPLADVLQPSSPSEAIETDHRLIWAAMPDEVQRAHTGKRDDAPFLWRRDDQGGRYYVLGPPPRSDSTFFHVESKSFEARLSPGDRLEFVLRLNATIDRRTGGRNGKRERSDVAMDLLRPIATNERAGQRQDLAARAASDWLDARAEAAGVSWDAVHLDGYRAVIIRRDRRKPGRIGVFDLRGLVTVHDPAAFLDRLGRGFGRAKAFGCGLMLVRRAG